MKNASFKHRPPIAEITDESLESEKDLQNSIDSYQELLKLNNIIEKKFHKTTKIINEATKKKINNITSKKNDR